MSCVPARSCLDVSRRAYSCRRRGKSNLEHHARGDDGGDSQLHQRSSITGKHHTQPVHGVRAVRRDDTVQGHLAHDQEDNERDLISSVHRLLYVELSYLSTYRCPHHLLLEWSLGLRGRHLGKERSEGFDEIKKSHCGSTSEFPSASPQVVSLFGIKDTHSHS